MSDDIAYVSGFPDSLEEEARFTRLFAMNTATDEKWFHHDLNGHRVVSVCLRRATQGVPRAVCALSEEGVVEIANSAGQTIEQIPGSGLGPGSRALGPMRRIREVAHRLYACGSGNQVYARLDDGWKAMDQQFVGTAKQEISDIADVIHTSQGNMSADDLLALTQNMGNVGGLDDIAGLSHDDIYACGLGGALWHWSGQQWHRLDTFTDDHLHCIHVISDKTVWVCGHNGTLLKGNKDDGFRSLLGPEVSDHFWSVREFNGTVYLGTTKGLFIFDGASLSELRLPGHFRPPVIQALDSTEETLWIVAERFVARLQSGQWERFDHPDNT